MSVQRTARRYCCALASVGFVSLVFAQPFAAAGDAEIGNSKKPRERVVYSRYPWVVWVDRKYVGNPRLHARRFRSRYWMEHVEKQGRKFLFEITGVYEPRVRFVRSDGAAIFSADESAYWILPGGQKKDITVALGGGLCTIVQAYEDGIVVQPYLLNQHPPIYFVRLDGTNLDVDHPLMLVPEGQLRANWEHMVLRVGDQLVAGRFLYDFKTKQRRELDIPGNAKVMAFDGDVLFYWGGGPHGYLSLRRGHLPILGNVGASLGIHDGFAYSAHIDKRWYNADILPASTRVDVFAVDLYAKPQPDNSAIKRERVFSFALHEPVPNESLEHSLFLSGPAGLFVRTGEGWQKVDWLARDERVKEGVPER